MRPASLGDLRQNHSVPALGTQRGRAARSPVAGAVTGLGQTPLCVTLYLLRIFLCSAALWRALCPPRLPPCPPRPSPARRCPCCGPPLI